jgi:hypothetical protein
VSFVTAGGWPITAIKRCSQMTLWVLFAIVVLNGDPVVQTVGFKTQADCEAVKTKLTEQLIKTYGDFEGAISCHAETVVKNHA